MADLVRVPWQTSCLLAPSTLDRLITASKIAGHNIVINGTDGAWREYATQANLYALYLAYLRGGPYAELASNPDTGQRNHMRGAGVDILNRADRAAMLAAGFTPDDTEWWHFNDPNWANMPIIKTATSVADLGATIITEAPDMDATQAAQLQAVFNALPGITSAIDTVKAQLANVDQRESRARLFKNESTGQLLGVDWDIPVGSPNRILYIRDETQANNLRQFYEIVGDTPAQAVSIPDAQWNTLIGLAKGTDPVYTPWSSQPLPSTPPQA